MQKNETGFFKHSSGNTQRTTGFYNLKFSWELGKFATKHVFITFSRKSTGFWDIFKNVWNKNFKKKIKKWNISNGQELTPYSDYNVPYECKTNGSSLHLKGNKIIQKPPNIEQFCTILKQHFQASGCSSNSAFDGNRSKMYTLKK